MPKKEKRIGVRWGLVYRSLRSEKFPHEIRLDAAGMDLQQIKQLNEEEYIKLVNRVYQDMVARSEVKKHGM